MRNEPLEECDTARTGPGPDAESGRVDASIVPLARLGRYTLLHLIGRGGMSIVFAGRDPRLDRPVAIKLHRHADGPESRSRLLGEAQALARLSHPNVVAIHELGEAGGRVFLVMERIVGTTLRTWLQDQRPDQAALFEVLLQIGRGIAAVHAAGLVHRDIKPDNVMVDLDGRARLIDLGLARVADGGPPADELPAERDLPGAGVTRTSSLLGTPGYMAPEQYVGAASTPQSDIFSFCVLLFEVLYGRRPFVGGDPRAIHAAILRGEIRRPEDVAIDPRLDALVSRGLAAAPARRWPSMQALLAALVAGSPRTAANS